MSDAVQAIPRPTKPSDKEYKLNLTATRGPKFLDEAILQIVTEKTLVLRLEDKKPWFKDEQGEGKGVIREFVNVFVHEMMQTGQIMPVSSAITMTALPKGWFDDDPMCRCVLTPESDFVKPELELEPEPEPDPTVPEGVPEPEPGPAVAEAQPVAEVEMAAPVEEDDETLARRLQQEEDDDEGSSEEEEDDDEGSSEEEEDDDEDDEDEDEDEDEDVGDHEEDDEAVPPPSLASSDTGPRALCPDNAGTSLTLGSGGGGETLKLTAASKKAEAIVRLSTPFTKDGDGPTAYFEVKITKGNVVAAGVCTSRCDCKATVNT
jgi:hypothetical protein